MRTAVQTNVSAADYLEMERHSDVKHEFVYGNIFEISGAKLRHNDIIGNINAALRVQVNKEKFKVRFCEVQVEPVGGEVYFYPDVVVGKVPLQNTNSYIVREPVLIAEVLSPSTRFYDSTDKFIQYRKSNTLQYYLLVEQEKQLITVYSRVGDDDWQSDVFTQLSEIINLPMLEVNLSLADVYED